MCYNLCRSTSVLIFYRQKINAVQYNYVLSCVYNDRGIFQIRRIVEDRRNRIIVEPRGGEFQIMIASATYAVTVRRRIDVSITINNNTWPVAGATSGAFPARNFVTGRRSRSTLPTNRCAPPSTSYSHLLEVSNFLRASSPTGSVVVTLEKNLRSLKFHFRRKDRNYCR